MKKTLYYALSCILGFSLALLLQNRQITFFDTPEFTIYTDYEKHFKMKFSNSDDYQIIDLGTICKTSPNQKYLCWVRDGLLTIMKLNQTGMATEEYIGFDTVAIAFDDTEEYLTLYDAKKKEIKKISIQTLYNTPKEIDRKIYPPKQ